jgi:colicin import membrane protein
MRALCEPKILSRSNRHHLAWITFLPTLITVWCSMGRADSGAAKPKKQLPRKTTAKADRKAALAFEREQARRESERKRDEAVREKERARRQRAVDKAQGALNQAERAHRERAAALEVEREGLDKRSREEDAQWKRDRERLEKALRQARDM